MRTVVLASQKGGSGKTTLSGHLAVQAELTGAGPVALIDTDPQGSLVQWWNARKSETPHFVKVGLPDLADALEQLRISGFKMVVIDTPPAISSSISHVVSYADLVIIPVRPSPHDLRAVGPTADIVERHEKPMIFVINCATQRARITGEAAVALSQHGTVAPVMLHNRVDFAASMIDGRTVGEVVPDSTSSVEVRDLWNYVQDRLSRLTGDPLLMPEVRAQHLSVSSLTPLDDQLLEAAESEEKPAIERPTLLEELPERRVGSDRRPLLGASLGGAERRSHAFGRRLSDRQPVVQGE